MSDNWLSLAKAVDVIETHLGVPTGPAQVELIEACATGKVRSIERNPEHGKEGVEWWPFNIPASEWAPAAHIDRSTGEALLNGHTYGSRVLTKECGRDADGYDVLRAWLAEVLISNADLQHWLSHRDTPAVVKVAARKSGRPPKQRDDARVVLERLQKSGKNLNNEKQSVLFNWASSEGYSGSERTLRRARGGK